MVNNNADMGLPFVLLPSGVLVANAQVRVRKARRSYLRPNN